jgi:Ni,Fe-hydrogenase III large subunit/Ni,Fe-hydrogenase III component G
MSRLLECWEAEAMVIPGLTLVLERIVAPLPLWHARVSLEDWQRAAIAVRQSDGRLVSLWARNDTAVRAVSVAYALTEGLVWLELSLEAGEVSYPSLDTFFPAAARMQRAAMDLSGIGPEEVDDRRPWFNHGAWPEGYFPLRDGVPVTSDAAHGDATDYPFVRVEGDGVHEIAVGPVHAGVIEPGHFRFSVVGEKVLRLEQRLGYTHKGIEQRFTQLHPLQAHRLAGRVSGDSTVAYAWAYCMALEAASGCEIPLRARWLRALMLERERVANHLGDLGALGNDVALAFGLAQFSRLREDWLRLSREVFGHRLMMDCIVPGGVSRDVDPARIESMSRQSVAIQREVLALRGIYEDHAGLQDRFMGTGRVTPDLAGRLGLTGMAGRASGQARDLRCDQPWAPYDALTVKMATQRNGDVAARATVRFDEVAESMRLIRALLADLPPGAVCTPVNLPANGTRGAGWIEGWRGEIIVALEIGGDADGHTIRRCHCHDPSWQNWPVLEHAVMGNIVPDFPLINKSFNLSYSGHDL